MVNRRALLQERDRLLREFNEVQGRLAASPSGEQGEAKPKRFSNLPPGKAIRKLLADEARPLERTRIVWELIAGEALLGSKHVEENILRAIDVNVELGLLVEVSGRIGLPEWQNNERLLHRMAKDERVRTVLEQMHAALGTGMSIAQLAESVDLSPSRLTHLFQKELSITPMAYMRRIRMRVVRHMLRTTQMKQKEILRMVGIADRSHFSREFKRLFRNSPSKIRKHPPKMLYRNRNEYSNSMSTRIAGYRDDRFLKTERGIESANS